MTLSLAAVFIPVLFMGGVLGRLFKEFAVTICVAILISGVVSVTLTPMLSSRFLRLSRRAAALHGSIARTERFFERMLQDLRPYAAGRCCATAAPPWRFPPGCWWRRSGCLSTFRKGFIPDQDTDQLQAITEAAQGTSFYQMVEYQEADRGCDPRGSECRGAHVERGRRQASTLGGPNFGQMLVRLKPRSRRKLLVNDVIEELRPKLSGFEA